MSKITHLTWVTSESEQRKLESLGWKPAEQRITHHHAHAMLMQWHGRGEPKLPTRVA